MRDHVSLITFSKPSMEVLFRDRQDAHHICVRINAVRENSSLGSFNDSITIRVKLSTNEHVDRTTENLSFKLKR